MTSATVEKIADLILELSRDDYETYTSIVDAIKVQLGPGLTVSPEIFLEALSSLKVARKIRLSRYDQQVNDFVEISALPTDYSLDALWFSSRG